MKILLCCRYKNQHVVVKIQLFLVCMRLYSEFYVSLKFHAHQLKNTPNKQKNPKPQCQTPQQTHKTPTTTSIHCQCYLHSDSSDHKIQEKIQMGRESHSKWCCRLSQLSGEACRAVPTTPLF